MGIDLCRLHAMPAPLTSPSALTSPAVLLEHLYRHRVLEAPDYFDRTLAFEPYQFRRAKICEGNGAALLLLCVPCKDQDRVTAVRVVDQVLTCRRLLRGLRLRLPMEKIPADRIIRIHGARGELTLRLLECYQQRVCFYFREMENADPRLSGSFQCGPSEISQYVLAPIPGVKFQMAGESCFGGDTSQACLIRSPSKDLIQVGEDGSILCKARK